MTFYFIIEGSAGLAGTDYKGKFKIEGEKEEFNSIFDDAQDIGYDIIAQHTESYQDVTKYEEENGVEFEYDYHVFDVSEGDYLGYYAEYEEEVL